MALNRLMTCMIPKFWSAGCIFEALAGGFGTAVSAPGELSCLIQAPLSHSVSINLNDFDITDLSSFDDAFSISAYISSLVLVLLC